MTKKYKLSANTIALRKKLILDPEFEWLREMICANSDEPDRPTINIGHKQIVPAYHLILNKKEGFFIDHINGDKFDNRLCNLRYVTISQNGFNKRRQSNYKTPHRGVRALPSGKYRALRVNRTSLGVFDTLEEASKAADKDRMEYYGKEFFDSCKENILKTATPKVYTKRGKNEAL